MTTLEDKFSSLYGTEAYGGVATVFLPGIQGAAISGAKALTVSFALWDNDTAKHENFESPTVIASGFTLNANSESTWLTSFTGSCNTTPSRNFSIQMKGSYSDRVVAENTSVPLGIRIYQRIYSSIGDSGWVHTDIWFS